MAVVTDLVAYYQSFINILYHQKTPQTKIDLFHWSFYIFFTLWDKDVTCDGVTAKELFGAMFQGHTSIPIKYIFFNRWNIPIIVLLLPFVFIILGLFKDPIFFSLITNPDFIHLIPRIKAMESCNEHQILTNYPVSFAYNIYAYFILQNEYLCIGDKHLFHEFCQKHSIPTIKCIQTLNELNDELKHNKEFMIKDTLGHGGVGIFCTIHPQKYINQIPDVVIQPRLRNHEDIVNISNNTKTLCTLRVSTYNKETHLRSEAYLKIVDEDCVTDNITSNSCAESSLKTLLYNKETSTFSEIRHQTPFLEAPKDKKALSVKCKIEGLDEFIEYLETLHHKYLNDSVGIGWDITKITNGQWIVVECNSHSGYYFSNTNHSQKIMQWFLQNIERLNNM